MAPNEGDRTDGDNDGGRADTGPGAGTHRVFRHDTSLRVLGIAMIVDRRGIGPRLIARYPIQPTPALASGKDASPTSQNEKDEIFFKLTSYQMAKLFRTKKTLCGQPMTLNVNGTVFCCRAILMEGDDNAADESKSNNNATANATSQESPNGVVLFSVVVALSSPPHHGETSSSASAHPSYEHNRSDEVAECVMDLQRFMISMSAPQSTDNNNKHQSFRHASTSFMCIRRVHLSLARFCRVLEREEHRCRYVSRQSDQFFRIRSECNKKWEERRPNINNTSNSKQSNAAGNGSGSGVSNQANQATSDRRMNRHMRQGSFSASLYEDRGGQESKNSPSEALEDIIQNEQEKEQEVLELMLAAPPPPDKDDEDEFTIPLHGNLVRELVQIFHSLSRNDYEFSPTPSAILSERDSVVFVNRHIAIPIESASLNMALNTNSAPTVCPYHTLLFPHASPSELLHAFKVSGSTVPQRLQQLLLTVNAQKPLSEIALDANLSLYATMEIASYLIAHGACMTSPVVGRNSRLACRNAHRIPQLSLEFSQAFSNVDLFRLTSLLTSSPTLGEAMSVLTDTTSTKGKWLRDSLQPFVTSNPEESDELAEIDGIVGNSTTADHLSPGIGGPAQPPKLKRWEEEMEELLYAMAMWLLSHRLLCQIQDYIVVASVSGDTDVQQTNNGRFVSTADEKLLKELTESDCVDGRVSIPALCWRMALDPVKVRSWGHRHPRVRIVSRIPLPGDD